MGNKEDLIILDLRDRLDKISVGLDAAQNYFMRRDEMNAASNVQPVREMPITELVNDSVNGIYELIRKINDGWLAELSIGDAVKNDRDRLELINKTRMASIALGIPSNCLFVIQDECGLTALGHHAVELQNRLNGGTYSEDSLGKLWTCTTNVEHMLGMIIASFEHVVIAIKE